MIYPTTAPNASEMKAKELKDTYGDRITKFIIRTNMIGWLNSKFFLFRALSVTESYLLENKILADPIFHMMLDGKASNYDLNLYFLEEIYQFKKELIKK